MKYKESKRRSFKKLNELLAIDISSGRFYSPEDSAVMEKALLSAVFNADNPISRCISSEIDFDTCPFPSKGSDGRTHLHGPAHPTLMTMLACHPDSVIKDNTVYLTVVPERFCGALQDAFLAYLAAFRTRSEVKIRLASDRRFVTLVDPFTGEVREKPTESVALTLAFRYEYPGD